MTAHPEAIRAADPTKIGSLGDAQAARAAEERGLWPIEFVPSSGNRSLTFAAPIERQSCGNRSLTFAAPIERQSSGNRSLTFAAPIERQIEPQQSNRSRVQRRSWL